MEQTVDLLQNRLERVYLLADVIFTLLVGNPQAQEITKIIMETATLTPEA